MNKIVVAVSILATIFVSIGLNVFVSFQHEAAVAQLCWNKGINPVTLPVAHQECEDSITWKDYFKRYNKVEGTPPKDEEIINRNNLQYSL